MKYSVVYDAIIIPWYDQCGNKRTKKEMKKAIKEGRAQLGL